MTTRHATPRPSRHCCRPHARPGTPRKQRLVFFFPLHARAHTGRAAPGIAGRTHKTRSSRRTGILARATWSGCAVAGVTAASIGSLRGPMAGTSRVKGRGDSGETIQWDPDAADYARVAGRKGGRRFLLPGVAARNPAEPGDFRPPEEKMSGRRQGSPAESRTPYLSGMLHVAVSTLVGSSAAAFLRGLRGESRVPESGSRSRSRRHVFYAHGRCFVQNIAQLLWKVIRGRVPSETRNKGLHPCHSHSRS